MRKQFLAYSSGKASRNKFFNEMGMISVLSTQMWRMPYVVTGLNLVGAMAAVALAAVASGGAVAWRLRQLDLVGALKARE